MTAHILILCTHNCARSVLGEGMLNHLAAKLGKDVQAHSAGSAPSGRINPFAIEALQVFFNSALAYWLNRRLGESHSVACPSALIGASNFFELAVAARSACAASNRARRSRRSSAC